MTHSNSRSFLGRTPWLALAVSLFVVSGLRAQEAPDWTLVVVGESKVRVENPTWIAKDYGWLLTCRLKVASSNAVAPVSYVELEGWDVEDLAEITEPDEEAEEAVESIWTTRQVFRRRDFDGAFGGGEQLFLRILAKDVPSEVTLVTLWVDDGGPSWKPTE